VALFSTESLASITASRGLVFPRDLLAEVIAALDSGRHIMLTGSPGTGKTSLAYAAADLAREAMRCTGYVGVTASAEWSGRETIGYDAETPEGLVFHAGVFVDAIQTGRWLVIDELNRADFDRAFGPLFTVLANQPVILPHNRAGHSEPIAIVPAGGANPPGTDVIAVPRHWRMVATMNEFDKATLHRLSYALMRRFAFVEVTAPPDAVVRSLVAGPGEVVAELLPVRQFVDLGPAVFMDAARFVARRLAEPGATRSRVLFEAFYAFLLPQLDALDDHEARQLFDALAPLLDTPEVRELGRAIRKTIGGAALVHEPRHAAVPAPDPPYAVGAST